MSSFGMAKGVSREAMRRREAEDLVDMRTGRRELRGPGLQGAGSRAARNCYTAVNPELRRKGCTYQLELVAPRPRGDSAAARGIMRAPMQG